MRPQHMNVKKQLLIQVIRKSERFAITPNLHWTKQNCMYTNCSVTASWLWALWSIAISSVFLQPDLSCFCHAIAIPMFSRPRWDSAVLSKCDESTSHRVISVLWHSHDDCTKGPGMIAGNMSKKNGDMYLVEWHRVGVDRLVYGTWH